MNPSTMFLQLKAMIEKDWLVANPTEFVQQLQSLKEEGKLTEEERRTLMQIYLKKIKGGA